MSTYLTILVSITDNDYRFCIADVVAFDNRFSWVHNKAVTYIIELIRPKNVEDINNHIEKKSAEAITEILECTSL